MIDCLYKKQEVLILNFNELPECIKENIRNRESFHNDCYLNTCSEFEPTGYDDEYKDWSSCCTMERIENYWKAQRKNNSDWCKSETLEQFIEEYGLQFEKWLITESGINLKGVEKILFEICW